jgi:ABC-2 type transport system permease protein
MNANVMAINNPELRTFSWLLKREYWESRGGFLRAPFIIATVILSMFVLMMIIAEVTATRHGVNIGGLNLEQVIDKIGPDAAATVANGLDTGLLVMCAPIVIGMTFVVFFYLLGALYDDRKDRSVLFFKSLPVSDTTTVLSKLFSALIIAPVIAVGACIALNIAFLLVMTVYALLHGVNAILLLWHPLHLLALWIKLLALIPINALWALPTAGWLLLCSSYVRSKPFLFAVVLPILAGVAIGTINLMQALALPSTTYWRYVFYRILGGLWPGSWLSSTLSANPVSLDKVGDVSTALGMAKFDFVNGVLSYERMGMALMSPELWIGVIAGAGMIAAAIYFRRERTDSYN